MEVYQVIYTSVKSSLSDAELGLENGSGLRVYSCSEGLTRQNLDEIIKFCSYRLPKNNQKEYSQVVGDPGVPQQFPKIFRTIRLSDGKMAAMQSVFSGVDHEGQEGNFFAHALIFEDYDNSFFPEKYYKNPVFKTYLTGEEAENESVSYLPKVEGLNSEETDNLIYEFINTHKCELSYLINKAMTVITDDELSNLCIVTNSEEETAMYLVALKYLLPRDMEENLGISTYNVYLPSNRQKKIVLHGSIKGNNNITAEAIEYRKNCLYVDMTLKKFEDVEPSPLLTLWDAKALRDIYSEIRIKSTVGLLAWVSSYKNVTSPGMGSKLIGIKENVGEAAFVKRANEIYQNIDDDEYEKVRFEIYKVMYDNIDYFQKQFSKLIASYIDLTMKKLCEGENYDMENMFSSKLNEKQQIAELKKQIAHIIEMASGEDSKITDKNKFILLGFFAHIKHKFDDASWKEFFAGNKNHLSAFVEFGAKTIVTDRAERPFDPPSIWTKQDLSEFVAFLEASTDNEKIGNLCLRYIYGNDDVDWESMGVIKTKHKKTMGEQAADLKTVHSLLSRVGYEPYQRGKYIDLVSAVKHEMEKTVSPLLLVRLLNTFYRWQRSYGNQEKAKKLATKLRDLILEMRKTQPNLYNYVMPKLALEIIESQGHYHEMIINTDTMYEAFWNWFLIGYKKCRRDDEKALNYSRIYRAIEKKISRLPSRKKLRAAFADQQ